jgi:hypothetical protein
VRGVADGLRASKNPCHRRDTSGKKRAKNKVIDMILLPCSGLIDRRQ